MKDTKDFQERYNRWKNGERYWDIRGVELPKYDTGKYVTVEKDDGFVYNINPNVANAKEITVTTPEIEVVAQKPQWMIDRDNQIGRIIPTQYTLREDNTPLQSQVDKFIDKYKYKTNNVILSGLANAADDWRRDKSPLRAAARYFGQNNPIASVTSAVLDDKLNTQSNTPKLIIPELIMDYGNKYGSAIRGYNHLMSKDGLKKTTDYYNTLRNSNPITDSNYAGKFWNTVTSGIGDVLDLSFINRAINNALPRNIGRIPINDNFYYKSRDVATKLKQQIDQAKQAYRNYKDIKAGYDPYYEIPLDVKFPPRVEIPITKQLAGKRHQFDVPTYQIYTGPRHSISEIMDRQGNVKLRNLLKIQNEALEYIPGGTIARHRLENKTWHPTDWNTFLHTRDAYKRAIEHDYPKNSLFPILMHDAGKLWAGDGHGPYGASIVQQIFPESFQNQIQAIRDHMDTNPINSLTRLVKGVDIKEPNIFRSEWVLRNNDDAYYITRDFNAERFDQDGIEIYPRSNSEFGRYGKSIYEKLNRKPMYGSIRIYPKRYFEENEAGDHDINTGISRISDNAKDPIKTAVHEAISHFTDDLVENEPVSKFIPKDNEYYSHVPVSVFYKYLIDLLNKHGFKTSGSDKWYEMRASLNEFRFNNGNYIENMSDDELIRYFGATNGYTQDYAYNLNLLTPAQRKKWIDAFKTAYKYLPAAIPAALSLNKNNNEEK